MRSRAPKDTRPDIFDRLFLFRTSYKASRSVESIRNYGMPTTGDPDIDRDMHHQAMDLWITINDVVELMRQNLPVSVVHRRDTVDIYKAVMNHLRAWEYDQAHEYVPAKPPTEDLALLVRLADELFEYVKYEEGVEPVDDLAEFFGVATGVTATTTDRGTTGDMFRSIDTGVTHGEAKAQGIEPELPTNADPILLTDAFRRRLTRAGGGRRTGNR